MDFVEGLPRSWSKTTILVVVETLKICSLHFSNSSLHSKIGSPCLHREYIQLYGMPREIVSDRDSVFTSDFQQELWALQGSKLHFSTAFHPQAEGQTEVVNRCFETYLRCFISHKPQDWSRQPWAQYWYNTNQHSSTKITPYQALYGRASPTITTYIPKTSRLQAVEDELIERDISLQILKDNLVKAQERMKSLTDRKMTKRVFFDGDWVYLRLQPYRQCSN